MIRTKCAYEGCSRSATYDTIYCRHHIAQRKKIIKRREMNEWEECGSGYE